MNPDPFTLGELCVMADAVQLERWNHTSSLMSIIYNMNRDPKKGRARSPHDFNPMLAGEHRHTSGGVPITPKSLKSLAKVFAGAARKVEG